MPTLQENPEAYNFVIFIIWNSSTLPSVSILHFQQCGFAFVSRHGFTIHFLNLSLHVSTISGGKLTKGLDQLSPEGQVRSTPRTAQIDESVSSLSGYPSHIICSATLGILWADTSSQLHWFTLELSAHGWHVHAIAKKAHTHRSLLQVPPPLSIANITPCFPRQWRLSVYW